MMDEFRKDAYNGSTNNICYIGVCVKEENTKHVIGLLVSINYQVAFSRRKQSLASRKSVKKKEAPF